MKKREISYSDWQKEIDKLYNERKERKQKNNLTDEQVKFLQYCLDENKKPKIPYTQIAKIYNKTFRKNYPPDSFSSLCCKWKKKGIL